MSQLPGSLKRVHVTFQAVERTSGETGTPAGLRARLHVLPLQRSFRPFLGADRRAGPMAGARIKDSWLVEGFAPYIEISSGWHIAAQGCGVCLG